MKKRTTGSKFCVLLTVVGIVTWAMPAGATVLPAVDITGLTGAAHWIVWEAEDADTGTATGFYKGNAVYSGYGINPNCMGGTKDQFFQWTDLNLPAAMSSATLYCRYGSDTGHSYDVQLNGSSLGSDPLPMSGDGYMVPVYWDAGFSMGSVDAGDNTLRITVPDATYAKLGLDCMCIYDGEVEVPASKLASWLTDGGNPSWMTAPTPTSYRQIVGSVTAGVTVTGADGGYTITLDGETYTPGTAITELGEHRLIIEAWGVDNGTSDYGRILVGADFEIVPEPTTLVLLGLGGFAALARRR